MLGKSVSNKKTLTKEKANKDRKRPPKECFPKGVDGQETKKHDGILKAKTKGKERKKQNSKKRRILKTGLLGEQKKTKKTLKLQENSLLGPFTKQKNKHTEKKEPNHKKNKTNNKKHPFVCWKTTPYFQLTLFYFCKAVFC